MTPQEKAEELIKRYYRDSDLLVEDLSWIQAKECALIAVDVILTRMIGSRAYSFNEKLFWSEVKSELQSL